MTFSNINEDQIIEVARQLADEAKNNRVITFIGNLGAGKTTLIKLLCRELNIVESVSSPTYSLINQYKSLSGEPLYHFDLYRLKNLQEAYDLGLPDYLDSGHVCLLEWPEVAASLLPENYLQVEISGSAENRTYVLSHK